MAKTQLKPGTTVDGRYQIVRLIGRGGFAAVYEAVHLGMKRHVALKMPDLPTDPLAAERFVARFLREAKVAAQIQHRNAVRIYDFGFTPEKQPMFAMELLIGTDLETELTLGAMPETRAIPLMIGALDVLGLAHGFGIVHKDLKPANLFLTRGSDDLELLRVLDFGLARQSAGLRLTSTDDFAGTPAYASPEYIERNHVSPALDVYQMGLVLAEMLSGRRAVPHASPMACIIAHGKGELDIPTSLREGRFGAVIATATALDPLRRFPEAHAFARALAQAAGVAFTPSAPPPDARARLEPETDDTSTDPRTLLDGNQGAFDATEALEAVPVPKPVEAAPRQLGRPPRALLVGILVLALLLVLSLATLGYLALR